VAAPLPLIKPPMAATDVPRPFHHPGWVYERRWTAGAYGVRLINWNGRAAAHPRPVMRRKTRLPRENEGVSLPTAVTLMQPTLVAQRQRPGLVPYARVTEATSRVTARRKALMLTTLSTGARASRCPAPP